MKKIISLLSLLLLVGGYYVVDGQQQSTSQTTTAIQEKASSKAKQSQKSSQQKASSSQKEAGATESSTPQASGTSEQIPATYVRDVDGDTVVLTVNGKQEKVRMLLIDTPESVKKGVSVQPFAKEASHRTTELLEGAKTLTVSYEPTNSQYDRYDRLLAYVFVDGKLLQETLIEEGLGRLAYYKGKEIYYQSLVAAQEKAKAQKVGIWSIEGYVTDKGYNIQP